LVPKEHRVSELALERVLPYEEQALELEQPYEVLASVQERDGDEPVLSDILVPVHVLVLDMESSQL
jgi:hypothetical protein